MNKKSYAKRFAVCFLVLTLLLTALPVHAAAAASKADKALKTAVNAELKKCKIPSSASKSTAIKKAFDHMKEFKYSRAPLGFKPASQKKWEIDFAKELLKNGSGSCYHYAAAFAFMAKKVSKYPVRIGYGQAKVYNKDKWQVHAWTEIKIGKTWYIYDANANQFSKLRVGKWYKQKRSSMTKIYNLKTVKYINVEI